VKQSVSGITYAPKWEQQEREGESLIGLKSPDKLSNSMLMIKLV
jgi:hypothetical protein